LQNLAVADSGACAGFTTNITAGLSPQAYAGLQSRCLLLSPPSVFSAFYAAGISNIDPTQVSTLFTKDTIAQVPSNSSKGFTQVQVSNFSPAACRGLTVGHMENIPATSYPGFSIDCVKNISGTSFAGILPSKVANITKKFLGAILPTQAEYLLGTTLSNFSQSQIEAIPPTSFAHVSLHALYQLRPTHVPWITDAQVAEIIKVQPTVFDDMPCALVLQFTKGQQLIIEKDKKATEAFDDRWDFCKGPSRNGLLPGTKGLIWAGVALLVAAAVGMAYKYWKNQQSPVRKNQYESL